MGEVLIKKCLNMQLIQEVHISIVNLSLIKNHNWIWIFLMEMYNWVKEYFLLNVLDVIIFIIIVQLDQDYITYLVKQQELKKVLKAIHIKIVVLVINGLNNVYIISCRILNKC